MAPVMVEAKSESISQILGPIPGWLRLGEVSTINGVEVREVLGDYSHLNECDRPPAYIIEGGHTSNFKTGWDKSPTRAAIKQTLGGRPIAELAQRHSGEACAVLFNGESLAGFDLHAVRAAGLRLVGMNRTHLGFAGYTGPQPDYLCLVDQIWFDSPTWAPAAMSHPAIINGSVHRRAIGYRVMRHPRMHPFSFDLARDGFVGPVPCTTGYLALQFAVYAGFTDIYCLGLDMRGGHFDQTRATIYFKDALRHLKRIAEVTKAAGVRIWNSNPNSACKFFPFAPCPQEGVGGNSRPSPPPSSPEVSQ